MTGPALLCFAGRAGDHNARAMPAARALAAAMADRTGVEAVVIGAPEPPLDAAWDLELEAARPVLRAMQERVAASLAAGDRPLIALGRCAVALATLPAVARHRPDAVVVWFDAHADLNTPATSTTGYLGGLALSGPAGLWDSGLGAGLALDRVVLAGVRDLDPPERALVDRGRVALAAGPDLAAALDRAVRGRPVYVHTDCDVLEPGVVPTDYRVPGGLTLDGLAAAAAVLARQEVIGLEVGELEVPRPGDGGRLDPGPLLDALEPLTAALLR